MYRSGLVPRRATWLGLIGAPLIIVSGTVIIFGGTHPSHALHSLQAILTIPELFLASTARSGVSDALPRSLPQATDDEAGSAAWATSSSPLWTPRSLRSERSTDSGS
jgi:hypothetical protein